MQNAFNKYKSLEVDIVEICNPEIRTIREKILDRFFIKLI